MQGSSRQRAGLAPRFLRHLKASCKPQWPMVRTFAAISEELAMPAFLVGGVIRDGIRRALSVDVDIVWLGDVQLPGQRMVQQMGGHLTPKTVFGTLQWQSPSGMVIDLIQARSEHYPAPGALPQVAFADMEADLARRDFSCNAMAVQLLPHGIGPLLDPWGGLLDLRRGRLRVLHKKSFFDDPTRLFRAARMAARLGSQLCPQTALWAQQAVGANVLSYLSQDRILNELTLVWQEPKASAAIGWLDQWGILEQVAPGLRWSWGLARKLQGHQRLLLDLAHGHLISQLVPLWLAQHVGNKHYEAWMALFARSHQQQQLWQWAREQAVSQWKAARRAGRLGLARWLSQQAVMQQLWCTLQAQGTQSQGDMVWWWNKGRKLRSPSTPTLWLQQGFTPGPSFQHASQLAQRGAWQDLAPAQQHQLVRNYLLQQQPNAQGIRQERKLSGPSKEI